VFGPIGHVVLQGGSKMIDAKPVFSISPIVLQPAIVPVSSQRREVQLEVWSKARLLQLQCVPKKSAPPLNMSELLQKN